MLAVSPYESHHDPRFFQPHPARYDPTRGALQCPGSSLHEVPGISGIAGLVFGGGRYRSALTLRQPRWSIQHHISCKHEPTMQRHLRTLCGSARNPCMQPCYACACLLLPSCMHDVISTLGARTIVAATMQMDVMAAGNIAIEAVSCVPMYSVAYTQW